MTRAPPGIVRERLRCSRAWVRARKCVRERVTRAPPGIVCERLRVCALRVRPT